jgi:hypothetical protein
MSAEVNATLRPDFMPFGGNEGHAYFVSLQGILKY